MKRILFVMMIFVLSCGKDDATSGQAASAIEKSNETVCRTPGVLSGLWTSLKTGGIIEIDERCGINFRYCGNSGSFVISKEEAVAPTGSASSTIGYTGSLVVIGEPQTAYGCLPKGDYSSCLLFNSFYPGSIGLEGYLATLYCIVNGKTTNFGSFNK